MTNYFVFNGQSSLELGIRIKSKNVYSSPKRDLSLVSIPGRDGELINSNKRFGNATVSYTCFIPANSIDELTTRIRNIKKWLFVDCDSYHELTDSYDSLFFRFAIFNSKLDITDQVNKIGSFTITFSCQPFKYQIAGYEFIQNIITESDIFNPYPFASKPYIRIEGSGDIRITISNSKGNKTYLFKSVDGFVICDSELMNCYKNTTLKNSDFVADEFPALEGGNNHFEIQGNATAIYITPRWRCL